MAFKIKQRSRADICAYPFPRRETEAPRSSEPVLSRLKIELPKYDTTPQVRASVPQEVTCESINAIADSVMIIRDDAGVPVLDAGAKSLWDAARASNARISESRSPVSLLRNYRQFKRDMKALGEYNRAQERFEDSIGKSFELLDQCIALDELKMKVSREGSLREHFGYWMQARRQKT